MKKNIFPILLLLLFGFATMNTSAQSWNQKFSLKINYSSLKKQNEAAAIFNLLASNNNKNVNNLHLQLNLEMHFSIVNTGNGQLMLKYSGFNQKMTGDVFFRDFKVDTLLLPEKLRVEILLYQNNRLTDTLNRIISLTSGKLSLPLPGNVPVSEFSTEIKPIQIRYTSNNYNRFLKTAGLINNYYGYAQIMESLPRLLHKTSGIHPEASLVYLNYMILHRLESYVNQHDFSGKLHLNKYDPLEFIKHFDATLRLQTRMKTLSQQLLSENTSDTSNDKERFSRGMVAISIKAVTLSEEQQPYVAGSYNEFDLVFPDSYAKEFVRQVSKYYEQKANSEQMPVSQEIYHYFIDAASLKIRQKSFVRALDFLSDASYFKNNFPEVKPIAEFDSCLVHARDGLATSYLKVARMASDNNDRQLANRYMAKAAESLHAYNATIKTPKEQLCYPNYARSTIQMAEKSLKQARYLRTLSLIDAAKRACPNITGIDSLRSIACNLLLKQKLNVSLQMLEQGQIETARDSLLEIANHYPELCPFSTHPEQNKEITNTAATIFQKAVGKSLQLHKQDDNTLSMKYLKMASHLQKTFSLPHSSKLDSLVNIITIPYILAVADETNLEIWKKHFQKADSTYRLSQSLSLRYGLSENPEIKSTLTALSNKIKVAGCQWKLEKIYQLFTQAGHAVKAYQIASAKSHFLKAEKLYSQMDNCEEDRQQTDSIFRSFRTLFQFTDAYHKLTLELFRQGFKAVLPGFARLEEQYHSKHLNQFGLPYSGLYQFVKSQHSEKLIMEAVHYFIQNEKFGEALHYLQLSENVTNAKTEQKQIALGLVKNGIRPPSRFLMQSEWEYFARAYRKALSGKES